MACLYCTAIAQSGKFHRDPSRETARLFVEGILAVIDFLKCPDQARIQELRKCGVHGSRAGQDAFVSWFRRHHQFLLYAAKKKAEGV